MPVGTLALLDELTFDLPLKIVDQAIAEEGDKYTPPAGVPTLRRMKNELGRSGRKSGGGFYEYPEGGKKHLWKGLAEHFPAKAGYDVEELKKRFLYTQAMETARCLEEGAMETPPDADLGAGSEERRVGKECVSTWRRRWQQTNQKQNITTK